MGTTREPRTAPHVDSVTRSCRRKAVYRTRAIALMCGARYDKDVPWRAYRCKYCRKWHLTSKAQLAPSVSRPTPKKL